MKIFHTADWHLGKIVQGVYMTEDQQYVLEQFVEDVQREKPDAVIIAGDLYDRAVPPTEAVELLNTILEKLVLEIKIPVLAIAGNHDSPDRINFAVKLMEKNGLFLSGQMRMPIEPVKLHDEHGEVHFYLIPYADPAIIRYVMNDEQIRTHDDATRAITQHINNHKDPNARHVLIGHCFVTPYGEEEQNTSDSERPLSIGGTECVKAEHFTSFHYTALGHLHQAHYVLNEKIRYAGSPLKYSISEENHIKGYYVVELDGHGQVQVEKRILKPRREMRTITGYMEEIEKYNQSDDYVFVTLLDENPVLFPMEKIRAVFPNALHVERRPAKAHISSAHYEHEQKPMTRKGDMNPLQLFESFYREVRGDEASEDKKKVFAEAYSALLKEEEKR